MDLLKPEGVLCEVRDDPAVPSRRKRHLSSTVRRARRAQRSRREQVGRPPCRANRLHDHGEGPLVAEPGRLGASRGEVVLE